MIVEVYDFLEDKEKAESLGIDKIPAVAVLAEDGSDYGIRFYGIPSRYEFLSLLESPLIRASMVEATEFPQLSNRYGVGGVPHTVIGDSRQPMVGAYPEKTALEMILSQAGVT